jgi:hypothetical protein
MLKQSSFPETYLPLMVFLAIYGITSLTGIIILWLHLQPITALAEYFSGVKIPTHFSDYQRIVLASLTFGAPTAMAIGFHLAVRSLPSKISTLDYQRSTLEKISSVVFLILLFYVTYCLYAAGALNNLIAWSNHTQMVALRYRLFEKLFFFEFSAIYLFVPLSAAALLSRLRRDDWFSVKALIPLTAAVAAIAINVLIFQKRTAVIAALLIISATAISQATTWLSRRTVLRLSFVGVSLSVVMYFALVLAPSVAMISTPETPEAGKGTAVEGMSKVQNLATYAAMAPILRTSLPALFYVITYPDKHQFNGLDVGQDILGMGIMPDDNQVVWREMYQSLKGSTTAAYQFVLYSQVGLCWTLIISFLLGAALGAAWKKIVIGGIPGSARQALLGSIILLFSLYLAMDGIRTSLLSSSGLVWAWLFVALLLRVDGLANASVREDTIH